MLNDLLYRIDSNNLILVALFLIFFYLINFSLSKFFKQRNVWVPSLAASILIVYWIWRADFNLTGFFSGIGFSENLLYIILPIIIIAGLIFLIWKLGISKTLIILGIISIISGFTNLVYNKGAVIGIGVGLLILGIILRARKRREGKERTPKNSQSYNKVSNNKKLKNKKSSQNPNNSEKINEAELRNQGMMALTNAAKQFKQSIISNRRLTPGQKKFYGTWANFINYLKQARWGRNEREIIQRLHISKRDFVKVFNKYGKV